MPSEESRYFSRRAAEHEAASRVAASDIARVRHQELARLYRLRAAGAFRDRGNDEPAVLLAEAVPNFSD